LDVPVAPLLGYEGDPSVLGAPFFVMGFVAGDVPIESPPYTTAGFFLDASPGERRRLVEGGLSVLARVHAVDWRAAGLGWLLRPGGRGDVDEQLDLWRRYADDELRGRDHHAMAEGWAWLAAHRPSPGGSPGGAPVLCWGDPRPGNMIWQSFSCGCVTDFEAASIAPPELDLGWWLLFDRSMHEAVGVDRLAGEPSRDEQRVIYERVAGRPVGDTTWWEVFAALRYSAIVVRVMNRAVARGLMPADNVIWLENPAATCLVQLLDEVR
jgi:aminoglycoside phosphotransferase (APT) family kinase protein